jgi:tellurite resistance protein
MTDLLLGTAMFALLLGAYLVGHADGQLSAREREAHRRLAKCIKDLRGSR